MMALIKNATIATHLALFALTPYLASPATSQEIECSTPLRIFMDSLVLTASASIATTVPLPTKTVFLAITPAKFAQLVLGQAV